MHLFLSSKKFVHLLGLGSVHFCSQMYSMGTYVRVKGCVSSWPSDHIFLKTPSLLHTSQVLMGELVWKSVGFELYGWLLADLYASITWLCLLLEESVDLEKSSGRPDEAEWLLAVLGNFLLAWEACGMTDPKQSIWFTCVTRLSFFYWLWTEGEEALHQQKLRVRKFSRTIPKKWAEVTTEFIHKNLGSNLGTSVFCTLKICSLFIWCSKSVFKRI